MSQSAWVRFRPANRPERKTPSWVVETKDEGVELAYIHFFPRWRCFVFEPLDETIYEKDCLRVIADFCEQKTNEWRTELQSRKATVPA